jgi:hypothetical protein
MEKNAASNVGCKKNVDHRVFCCDDWMAGAQISTLGIFDVVGTRVVIL